MRKVTQAFAAAACALASRVVDAHCPSAAATPSTPEPAENLRSSNPTSAPLQHTWGFAYGRTDASPDEANAQPVAWVALGDEWDLVIRAMVPTVYVESPAARGPDEFNLGNILRRLFRSPKMQLGGWILGFGPALAYPPAGYPPAGASR